MNHSVIAPSDLKDWYFSVSKNFSGNNKLSVGARLLLIDLRSFAGTEHTCFPSRDLLCDRMGVNKDTLTNWLKELKESGYLTVEQVREGGRFLKNVYTTSYKPCLIQPCLENPYPAKPPLICTTSQHVPLNNNVPETIKDCTCTPTQNGHVNGTKTKTMPDQVQVKVDQKKVEAESIYLLYPRKLKKPDALKSILKALNQVQAEYLRERTAKFAELWEDAPDEEWQYCPHPATWFNKEQYNDDPKNWNKPRNGNGHNRVFVNQI